MITKRVKKKVLFTLCFTVLIFLGTAFISLAATKGEDTRPARGISIAFEYPEVIIDQGNDVSMDIIIKNRGKRDENIYFKVSEPAGWKARAKTYSFSIASVHVPEGEDRTVQFSAKPGEDTKPGTYEFKVDARTEDGKLKKSQKLKVTMQAKEKEEDKIEITTSYPVLRGESGARFEFSIDLSNELDKEANFNLSSNGPKDWQINFKPSYEDKYISSLRLKDNESKNLNVEVTPDRFAAAGEYYIPVTISSGEARASAELKVIITGTYKLEAGTATGLLSLETQKGQPGNISIYVKNSGSATIHGIEFLSIKPENWEVDFQPENIEVLEPGDLKQVEVRVVPAQEALVGDYAVGLNISGEKSSDDLELRITVNASTAWSWIGIGIIILVILGLFGLFVALGRR